MTTWAPQIPCACPPVSYSTGNSQGLPPPSGRKTPKDSRGSQRRCMSSFFLAPLDPFKISFTTHSPLNLASGRPTAGRTMGGYHAVYSEKEQQEAFCYTVAHIKCKRWRQIKMETPPPISEANIISRLDMQEGWQGLSGLHTSKRSRTPPASPACFAPLGRS